MKNKKLMQQGAFGDPIIPWSTLDNNSMDHKINENDKSNIPNSSSPTVEVAVAGKKRGRGKKGGDGESDNYDVHIVTERERRKKMRNMFANLHALLPQLPPKADKSTVVDEAVTYIKTLQGDLQKLQKQKLERIHSASSSIITPPKFTCDSRESFLADQVSSNTLAKTLLGANTSVTAFSPLPRLPIAPITFQTWTSENVILNVCGNDAQLSVCAPKKRGLLTAILYVMEKHKLEVVSAHVSSDQDRCMYMIHAHSSNGLSDQFPEAFPVEEIYKQAAGEIMYFVASP